MSEYHEFIFKQLQNKISQKKNFNFTVFHREHIENVVYTRKHFQTIFMHKRFDHFVNFDHS